MSSPMFTAVELQAMELKVLLAEKELLQRQIEVLKLENVESLKMHAESLVELCDYDEGCSVMTGENKRIADDLRALFEIYGKMMQKVVGSFAASAEAKVVDVQRDFILASAPDAEDSYKLAQGFIENMETSKRKLKKLKLQLNKQFPSGYVVLRMRQSSEDASLELT